MTISRVSRKLSVPGLALAALLFASFPAAAAGGAEILGVELQQDAGGKRPENYPDLTSQKFDLKPFGRDIVSGRERFKVSWSSGSQALPAGAALLLEYRRRDSDRVEGDSRQFDFAVHGERETVFQLDGARAEDGPIVMWRVRLVREGRLLAEQSSETWKD